MNTERIEKILEFIAQDPILYDQVISLTKQVFAKLARHERMEIRPDGLYVEKYLEYDIKDLTFNIVKLSASNYRAAIDVNFRLTEEEEEEVINELYDGMMEEIIESVLGVEA